jgi:hypothetical protein
MTPAALALAQLKQVMIRGLHPCALAVYLIDGVCVARVTGPVR